MPNLLRFILPIVSALPFLVFVEPARAGDVVLGAQAGVGVPIESGVTFGPALDALVGYRLHPGPLWIQPELTVGYRNFANTAQDVSFGASFGRVTAGARLGLAGLLQPQAYADLGGAFGGVSGFTLDVGGALDVKISIVYFGAQAGFGMLAGKRDLTFDGGPLKWIDLGGHLGVIL